MYKFAIYSDKQGTVLLGVIYASDYGEASVKARSKWGNKVNYIRQIS